MHAVLDRQTLLVVVLSTEKSKSLLFIVLAVLLDARVTTVVVLY
jgi:superfamily II DNA helicase RecQ